MNATVYISLDDTLKQMRAELRREFPGTRFTVRRARGTAYGWVSVGWIDGPTDREVTCITSGYEGAGFDGMTDSSYSIDHVSADAVGNPVRVQHGTRGINCSRTISADLANTLIAQIVAYWGGVESVPVAVPGWGDGYTLEPHCGHRPIRPDVSLDWFTAIHRAAADPTEYARGGIE